MTTLPDFQPIEIKGVTYYTNTQMNLAYEAGKKAGLEEAVEACRRGGADKDADAIAATIAVQEVERLTDDELKHLITLVPSYWGEAGMVYAMRLARMVEGYYMNKGDWP